MYPLGNWSLAPSDSDLPVGKLERARVLVALTHIAANSRRQPVKMPYSAAAISILCFAAIADLQRHVSIELPYKTTVNAPSSRPPVPMPDQAEYLRQYPAL